MTHNIPLAQQTLQFIQDHPEKHEQGEWLSDTDADCGTVGCFFGWAVHLECHVNHNKDLKHRYGGIFDYKGEDQHVQSIATKLLGLNKAEAQVIYNGSNTMEDLEDYVKAIANGESIVELFGEKLRERGSNIEVSVGEDGDLDVRYPDQDLW